MRNGTTTVRSFTYDGAGNILTDTRSGTVYTYTYNKANRLKTVTSQSNLLGTYTYNGFDQLIARVITNSGTANGMIVTVHDLWGNVVAELDGTGATVREYIWLPETEIAPTRQARTRGRLVAFGSFTVSFAHSLVVWLRKHFACWLDRAHRKNAHADGQPQPDQHLGQRQYRQQHELLGEPGEPASHDVTPAI